MKPASIDSIRWHDLASLEILNIDGLGTGAGLTIVNCVIRHLPMATLNTRARHRDHPSTGSMSFVISDTIVSDNAAQGIFILQSLNATISGVIDHAIVNDDGQGILINSTAAADITLSQSVMSHNTYAGVFAVGDGNVIVHVRDSIADFSNNGYFDSPGSKITLTRSEAANDTCGIYIGSGTVASYGDNTILDNSTNSVCNGTLKSYAFK